jgi:hypothetical protein
MSVIFAQGGTYHPLTNAGAWAYGA